MTAPLFGKDSIPHKTSCFFGITGTLLFWIIFSLCMIFIPVNSGKKQLKPVQIVLSSTPVIEKEKVFENSQSSSPKIDENPLDDSAVISDILGEQPFEISEVKSEEIQPVVPEVVETVVPEVIEVPVKIPEPVPEPKIEPKPVPKSEPKPEPKKIEKPKPVEKNENKPASKPVETVKESAPVQEFVEPQLVKSMEDLMAEQMNAPKKSTKNFDWDSMFGDDSDFEKVTDNQPQKVESQSSIAGTAGAASDQKNVQRTESTSSKNKKSLENATTETTSNLSKIKDATTYSISSGGSLGTVKAKTISTGTGNVSVEMSDGSVRALLVPEKPVINLSAEAASLIDTDKTVSISLKVLNSGNISEISISPESILPKLVRDEIRKQLMEWRFEQSSTSAVATFEYTIKKQ